MRIEHWWFTAPLRLKYILRRSRVEQELDEELQFHLEHKIEEGIARGLSPPAARLAASRAIDGLGPRKEEMRDMRHMRWLTDFVDDARYAIRTLRRTWGLTVFVAAALALGIGMTSATYSMLDALIFRPYPVPHPGSVVTLASTTRDSALEDFSYREYLDIRDQTGSYDGVIASAGMQAVAFSAEPGAMPRVRGGMMVSATTSTCSASSRGWDAGFAMTKTRRLALQCRRHRRCGLCRRGGIAVSDNHAGGLPARAKAVPHRSHTGAALRVAPSAFRGACQARLMGSGYTDPNGPRASKVLAAHQ